MAVKERDTSRERRDLALTACCAAAIAETDLEEDPLRRAGRLMDCLGLLRSAHPASVAATLDMRALRRGLREGISALLPADSDGREAFAAMVLIDEQGLLRGEVEDLGREHLVPRQALEGYWPWAQIRAEQEEQRLFEEIRRLQPEDYERVRVLLATHPCGDLDGLLDAWGGLWGRFALFEPVASWPWCNVAGWCFPCPRCRWPMRAQQDPGGVVVLSCDAHSADGVGYACRPGRGAGMPHLEGIGRNSPPVSGFPAAGGHLAVSRPVWRFFTLPGQMEVGFRDELARTKDLLIVLYPGGDAYDLHVTALHPLVAKEWRIDAKAWQSLPALGDALLKRPPLPGDGPLIIMVPHRQRAETQVLREQLAHCPDLRVATDRELLREVRRWCALGSAEGVTS
ncbi:hypothetical protein [Kitasatospora sp. NPDC056184]|uniref:restriction endonuclease-related protein n=1 Tax=Kitasatospora sp. NPDC056184 TaxID=3345738 RepID=UPI0035E330B3